MITLINIKSEKTIESLVIKIQDGLNLYRHSKEAGDFWHFDLKINDFINDHLPGVAKYIGLSCKQETQKI